ncbi:D-isomer specific 2-hydroxyacid dehydrogenase NAD-binding protein [Rhizobium sp. PDO1-076]|uniref:2-hydroxyacid dehydrogenase n=1 Tax=Rhizobium sp. PDO1-076 TaxID=1125979 RepID=UPI00024E2F76|nr:2-hydroxyacid dehydrogenase [Rhizobium sp. PDO1-076]EHS49136.1 D-isomer specific 2-hydroxyacid dehydrogenase NAD-binding protein [Rhizobium sp. PDO1-076]
MSAERVTVLIPGRIHPRARARLAERFELLEITSADQPGLTQTQAATVVGAAVSGRFPAALMEALPNLKVIASFGVGYDGVDVQAAAARGIVVTNTPDVLNDEVADTAIALLLNTVRRLPAAENHLRAGRWVQDGPFALSPLSLKGRHVGIHGLGRIGLEIAARLEPFKVTISYHTRRPRSDVSYGYHDTLLGLASAVDTLISIVPKTPETIGAINADVLKALGPNGVLINVGRGTTVDEPALIKALQEGTIAAAGLDVFAEEPKVPAEFLDLDNVSLLPHVASASIPTRNAMADLVVDNLLAWFDTGRPLTPVPETPFKA